MTNYAFQNPGKGKKVMRLLLLRREVVKLAHVLGNLFFGVGRGQAAVFLS